MSRKSKPRPSKNRPSKKTSRRPAAPPPAEKPPEHGWTFLSNHAHVLICLAGDPHIRMREVAGLIGITERAVLSIVSDLEAEGLVRRHREGRRNAYELRLDRPLRHPLEKHRKVSDLVKLIVD